MKRVSMLLALASVLLLFALPAKAQSSDVSIFSPLRLSVGARVYRNFDEVPGQAAGNYSSQWWAGLPLAWQITSASNSQFPVSLIGAIDVGIPEGNNKAVIRSYIGVGMLLKAGPR